MNIVVKTAGDPYTLLPLLRDEIVSLDPTLPLYEITTMDERLSDVVSGPRFNALLMGLFAFLALALGSVGLYGVIAYSVSRQTHEIGLRLALGAQRSSILRFVLGRGMLLTGIGLALGVAGALALTGLLQSLLFGVAATDWLTYVVVSGVLATVAGLACYLPARRAMKVDPMVALRYE